MRLTFRYLGASIVLGGLLVAMTGCQQQPPQVTVVDTAHGDTHKWDEREAAAYQRWEAENTKPHQEYANRRPEEQSDYWNWRHTHPQ